MNHSVTLVILILLAAPTAQGGWFNTTLTQSLGSLGRAASPLANLAQSLTSSQPQPNNNDNNNINNKEIDIEQSEAHRSSSSELLGQEIETGANTKQQDQQVKTAQQDITSQLSGPGYSGYGANLMSIAGIRPSSIASVLNAVGDTGFKYFNIEDQCRNRAACDLGYMLYKKLSFVHNWVVRTSVRSLTDMNNIYTQSWMEGMMGRNCTIVYQTCRQSPLDGIMNLGFLQQLALV